MIVNKHILERAHKDLVSGRRSLIAVCGHYGITSAELTHYIIRRQQNKDKLHEKTQANSNSD